MSLRAAGPRAARPDMKRLGEPGVADVEKDVIFQTSRTPGRPEASALLRVADVTVRFGGVVALESVSMEVRPGEIVSLIGPNGAGKTTLFNVIAGVVRPTGGTVAFRGKDLTGMEVHRRAHVGIRRTFQDCRLFDDLTLSENLVAAADLGKPLHLLRGLVAGAERRTDAATEQAESVIQALGLGSFRSVKARDLPTGVRRMGEFARLLGNRSPLWLLDEPTSGLDRSETKWFKELIHEAHWADPARAVLLVEHDMSVALELADYVYVLEFGHVICEGTPDVVREDRRVRDAYLGNLV